MSVRSVDCVSESPFLYLIDNLFGRNTHEVPKM